MASLTINAVSKNYGEVRALNDVSIDVEDGEFLVLVGPSGCGKSTLLRMIAGLEELTEGTILLDENDVSRVDPKDRDVAMVFQNYALYPHMTVFQNMAFSLEQRKTSKEDIRRIVGEAAATLDLTDLLDRKPGQLSGGQRQRVAMGRAIVRSPAIYLMDEPLSNLDAKLRVQMRAELKLLSERLGVTTVYVTHDQVEAMTLGDRVAVLAPYSGDDTSNLQQCASPRALYHKPRNLFVAGFIGSPAMNFFYVDIRKGAEGLELDLTGTAVVLNVSAQTHAGFPALEERIGQRVVMGLRPEFFSLKPQGNLQSLEVTVQVSEDVGADAFLHFELPTPQVREAFDTSGSTADDHLAPVSRFTARVAAEDLSVATGQMTLGVDLSRAHFFDPATTMRIE